MENIGTLFYDPILNTFPFINA